MKPTIWPLEIAKKKHRYSPAIAMSLKDILPRSDPVLDLGCGCGHYLRALADHGYTCLGIEGTAGIREIAVFENIIEADLSLPVMVTWPKSSIICLEVVEHLYPEHEEVLLNSIDRYCSKLLVLSWAVPGQKGHGHVNCRPNSYVCRQLFRRGFDVLAEPTFALREKIEDNVRYFRNTLLVMSRRDSGGQQID